MLQKANKVRFLNAMKNKYFLYEILNETPELTIYEVMKKINWSSGKIKHYIQKLLKDGVIQKATETINGRVKKRYSPVSYKEFINKEEMDFLK